MRVIHVINSLAVGGAERLVLWTAEEQASRGNDVRIIAVSGGASPYLEGYAKFGPSVHYLSRELRAISTVPAIAGEIREFRPDVVHAHLFPTQLLVALASLYFRDAAFVTTEHSTSNRRRRKFLKPLDAWIYSRYDAVACISHDVGTALAGWMPSTARKISVAVNGIPAHMMAAPVRTFRALAPKHLVSVGRLIKDKQFDFLIELVAQIDGVTLSIVGDGPMGEYLRLHAERMGVRSKIVFHGSVRDPERVLDEADIYLQPSSREGFGLAALEAMARGIPVIASDIPGIRELVGDAGLTLSTSQPEEWKDAIERLASDRSEWERLSRLALTRSGLYSVKRTVDDLMSIYASAMSRLT